MRYNTKGELINEDSPCYKEHGTYYEAHYSCSECSYVFSIISEQKPKGRCPACPKCKENPSAKGLNITKGKLKTQKQLNANSNDIITSRKTAHIAGQRPIYKAHEATMQMVMEDYGLTDINDRPYEGESSVPKLPMHLQKQVTEGFGASFGNAPQLAGNIDPAKIASVGLSQIHSGKFRDQGDVVAMQQKYGSKPKFRFINE